MRRRPRDAAGPGRVLRPWPWAWLLSAPLVLPMLGDLFGLRWMLPPLGAVPAGHAGAVHFARAHKAGWYGGR